MTTTLPDAVKRCLERDPEMSAEEVRGRLRRTVRPGALSRALRIVRQRIGVGSWRAARPSEGIVKVVVAVPLSVYERMPRGSLADFVKKIERDG